MERVSEDYKKWGGAIVLFASEPFATKLRSEAIDWYKYDWIWAKKTTTGFVHAKNMPLKDYENILVFSPASIGHKNLLGDRRMPYNPQGIKKSDKYDMERRGKFGSVCGDRSSHKKMWKVEYENYPRMVLTGFKRDKENLHPNQKPVSLLSYLIRTYTDEGAVVFDNCMGSGSTGVACLQTGRDFIGIEKDETYFETAKKRIESELV